MNKTWLISILLISFTLLCVLNNWRLRTITPYFRGERVIKLSHFQEAKSRIAKSDQDLLKLWESMLTGRSAPLASWMKERYQKLGLSHLFTPSGFHISAVLFPFLKVIPGKFHFFLILLLGIGAMFLPGMSALKRMLLIKGNQKLLGLHTGFILALIMDIFWGSFENSTLSFTYSFLFIGIIYSGAKGISLMAWFFLGQILIAYFQGSDVSPLVLVFSPFLNFWFGLAMPLLFLLAYPLWSWQLTLGIWILKGLQMFVDGMAHLSLMMPQLEIHAGVLIFLIVFLKTKRRSLAFAAFLLSSSLNPDLQKNPGATSNEFVPRGEIKQVVYTETDVRVVRSDGNCKLKLVRGFWWENCSPKRRSSHKKLKKLSYPS